ncbi:MAG: LacI family DNA-binding transcriptional regulator [Armatimonadetes bacterium]|nr:LacI family DNA-binding transcriptional regulator [Armatimonadota bacterium]MDE2207692.1 LacI family DNA-binding transcriptional regulator [Armatimonadota bacterium]
MARITLRDVANAAGTSVSAVSAVVNANPRHNIRVSTATRDRIQKAAAALDYSPNLLARSLVTRKTGVLGLVFPYAHAYTENNPFFSEVLSGVFQAVIAAGYNVMLHTGIGDDWDAADENTQPDPRTDGLILVLPRTESLIAERCIKQRIPFVSLVCRPGWPDGYVINADEFHGGWLAVRHLTELGHKRIAHFTGNPRIATSAPRLEGYLAALGAAGLEADEQLIVPSNFNGQAGYEAMCHVLALPKSNWPTAIFAANDLCAEGALRAITEQGLSVPHDFSLVGYDDTWFGAMLQPSLTSVHMPIAEMGAHGVSMLIELLEGRGVPNPQPVLPVHLTVRQSSGPPARR